MDAKELNALKKENPRKFFMWRRVLKSYKLSKNKKKKQEKGDKRE